MVANYNVIDPVKARRGGAGRYMASVVSGSLIQGWQEVSDP